MAAGDFLPQAGLIIQAVNRHRIPHWVNMNDLKTLISLHLAWYSAENVDTGLVIRILTRALNMWILDPTIGFSHHVDAADLYETRHDLMKFLRLWLAEFPKVE